MLCAIRGTEQLASGVKNRRLTNNKSFTALRRLLF